MYKLLNISLLICFVSALGQVQNRSTCTVPAEWEPQDAVWMGIRFWRAWELLIGIFVLLALIGAIF